MATETHRPRKEFHVNYSEGRGDQLETTNSTSCEPISSVVLRNAQDM